MKRLFKLACIILALGLVIAGTGVFIAVKKDGVTYYDIMDVVKVNLAAPDEQLKADMPELPDLAKIEDRITSSDHSYGLNEFNTVCVYSENIQTEFYRQTDDKMTVTVHSGNIISAVVEGTLYIRANSGNGGSIMRVGIPDSYKGGLIICGIGSRISSEPFESAMDISIYLKSSSLTAESFTADNIAVTSASSRADLGDIAADDFAAVCVSSELNTKSINCKESTLNADNTTIELNDIRGGFLAAITRSTYKTVFSHITGNITVDTENSRGDIHIPNNVEMTLIHDESYSIFNNSNGSVSEDNQSKYTIETDIKYSVLNIH